MKAAIFILAMLSVGAVKAAESEPFVVLPADAVDPIVDRLDDEYYQGRTDGLWDAAVGLCLRTGTKDLPKCAQSNYEALEAASNEVVIND